MKSRAVFFISPDCHYLSEIPEDKKTRAVVVDRTLEAHVSVFIFMHEQDIIFAHDHEFGIPAEVRRISHLDW